MPKYPPEPLTQDEVNRIIRACGCRYPTGIRNAALFTLLYHGGLRISEALALKPKDLDVRTCQVTVLHGKNDEYRIIGLNPGTVAVIERWLDRRKTIGLTGRHPLFCTISSGAATGFGTRPRRAGARLSDRYVRQALNRAAARAGVEKRVHPHGLRHSHAAELIMHGVPVTEIRDQLGHANISTTDAYLRRIAPADRLARLRALDWGAA
jgi:integrase/recombinase XerD